MCVFGCWRDGEREMGKEEYGEKRINDGFQPEIDSVALTEGGAKRTHYR